MTVLLDIGNTKIGVGLMAKEGGVLTCASLASRWEEFEVWYLEHEQEDEYLVSSVVPAFAEQVISYLATRGKRVTQVTYMAPWSFCLDVKEPDKVGTDRLAALEGALALVNPPLIVVDVGTAITFSVLSRRKIFVGGAIAPGLAMSLSALASGAVQLPLVELGAPSRLLGQDTRECLMSGVVGGAAFLMAGMIAGLKEELRDFQTGGRGKQKSFDDMTVIGTGGSSRLLAPRCPSITRWEPWLVLKGLRVLSLKMAGMNMASCLSC